MSDATGDAGGGDDPARLRRTGAFVLVGLVVVVVAVFALGGDARPEMAGAQFPSLAARVQQPGTREWVELVPSDRSFREGFPVPMIARGDQVCFGFGRLDFDPIRPSLARCVEADDIPELPAEGLISLVTVRAGVDTWHLLATAGELSAVRVADGDGSTIDPGRIHLDGEFVALRLDTSADVTGIDWIIGRTRFVCTPDGDAAVSGRFCAPDASGASG